MNTSSTSRAFTLIELLVVVAVIALLIGLVLTALSGARSKSLVLADSSNIRQIGIAIEIYTIDEDGRYPVWSGWQVFGDPVSDPNLQDQGDEEGLGWGELLAPGLDNNTEIFRNPALPEERHAEFSYFLGVRAVHYVRALATGRTEFFTTMNKQVLRFPSMYVLSGNSHWPEFFDPDDERGADCDKDNATQPNVFFEERTGIAERWQHAERVANILFGDGHVRAFAERDPSKMTWHHRRLHVWEELDPSRPLPEDVRGIN